MWAQGGCISRESIDRGDHWISLVWPEWIFTNDIKLSCVAAGLSEWVATGSGFLSSLDFHEKLNFNFKIIKSNPVSSIINKASFEKTLT